MGEGKGAAAVVVARDDLRPAPACEDCGGALSMNPRTPRKRERCRSCCARANNADASIRAKQTAGMRQCFVDPATRAARVATATRNLEKARQDPVFQDWLREHGRRIYHQHLNTPENRAKVLASRPEAARKRTATMLAWCPPELREEYRQLIYKKRMHAKDARKVIEDGIERRQARGRAADAAQFLRRDCAVFRCDSRGAPNPAGTHWRRGTSVLDLDGIVDLALRRGWQPNAWRQISQPTNTKEPAHV